MIRRKSSGRTRPSRISFFLSIPLALGACDPGVDGFRDAEIHPDEENAPPNDALLISTDTVPSGLSPAALSAWHEARDRLLGPFTTLRLGSQEAGPELFGRIGDAVVDAQGNVLVFDAEAMELRAFDPGGSHLYSFGGVGDGPLETRYNHYGVFDVLDGDRILIANAAQTKLFSRTEEEWTLEKMFEVPFLVWDQCVMNGERVFFSAWSSEDNTLVHPASIATGEMGTGFGEGYRHENHLVKIQMTQSIRVACLEEAGQVVVAWSYLPTVIAYSADDGTAGWVARVEGYLPSRVVYGLSTNPTTGDEIPTVSDRGERSDMLASMFLMPSGHIGLQYSRSVLEEGESGLRTYLVDAATGLGAFLGDDLPVIASIQPDGYIAKFSDPYPRLELRKFTEVRGGP